MKKEDLYVGMRVYSTGPRDLTSDVPGTIIDTQCLRADFDCLVEFDKIVNGHSGLNWGNVQGKMGHCFWMNAKELVEIRDESPVNYNMSYDDLMNDLYN